MQPGKRSGHGEADPDDATLIDAIRREPPDAHALQVLVDRHWRALFARCRVLTTSADDAHELAQETWCRVLRARQSLHAEGSIAGYLAMTATNLWRDRRRTARRALELAEHRLLSLDAPADPSSSEDGVLGDAVPDPASMDWASRAALRMDIDRALQRLEPRLRDVLIARYIDGESAAEIGRRYQRTEQTITSWLRQASQTVRDALGGAARSDAPTTPRQTSARGAASEGGSAGVDGRAAG